MSANEVLVLILHTIHLPFPYQLVISSNLETFSLVPICFPGRYLWREVRPLMERAQRQTVGGFIDFLMNFKASRVSVSLEHISPNDIDADASSERMITSVTWNVHPPSETRLIFWVYPNCIESLDNSFGSRLNTLERTLIKAQTAAGYFATLGGGFFMCHHWTTAVRLAQQQRKMALYLGNKDMYFKCWLNEAYNYIFAGYFSSARQIIRQVYLTVGEEPDADLVLLNMCKSAWLFCKRVKAAKLRGNKDISETVDDFSRIRLVEDKSIEM